MNDSYRLSERIIGAGLEVYRHLGYGFLERVYQRAFLDELQRSGLRVEMEKPVKVYYKNLVVGHYFVDLFIDRSFIVELKTGSSLSTSSLYQVKNYMRSFELEDALLFNFGEHRLEWRRVFP